MRSRLHRHRDPGTREVVAGCEAFVLGRYAEHLIAAERRVPVWAWTNVLAHGTEQDLRSTVVHGCIGLPDPVRPWWLLRAYLAHELLDRVSARNPLVQLQRVALVPLELELASRDDVELWRPVQLVEAVLARVDGYQLWRR